METRDVLLLLAIILLAVIAVEGAVIAFGHVGSDSPGESPDQVDPYSALRDEITMMNRNGGTISLISGGSIKVPMNAGSLSVEGGCIVVGPHQSTGKVFSPNVIIISAVSSLDANSPAA